MGKKLMRQMAILLATIMVINVAYTGQTVEAKDINSKQMAIGGVTAYEESGENFTVAETESGDEETATTDVETESGDEETGTTDIETESGDVETESGDVETESGDVETETGDIETESPEETTTEEYTIVNDLYKVHQATGTLVEYLGDKENQEIKELTIPAIVKRIEHQLFENFLYIEAVSFEEGSLLAEIGDYAFRGCTALKSIVLPEGLLNLGTGTLNDCSVLQELIIPSTVVSGKQILGKNCAVTKVTFAQGATTVPEEILKYSYNLKEVVMFSGVLTISTKAFYKCKALEKITIPSTVTGIKKSAFNGCYVIKEIKLPSGLKSIGSYAFKKCKALTSMTIPKNVSSIGKNIFSGVSNIVVKVYANSKGKKYARENKLTWEFTKSEKKRQAASTAIYNNYVNLVGKKNMGKFSMDKYLKKYVPQGTCAIGKYIVVSMYYKKLKKKSILVIYNRSSGKFKKMIKVPSKDHVGAVTNVKGKLVVSLNNISATDYVGVISLSKLKKTKHGKTVKYDYKVKLPGYSDFAAYDGKFFWSGRSLNGTTAKMQGYEVKTVKKRLTFTPKYEYFVPANIQGLVAKKSSKSSERTFMFAQSYGRLNDSKLITYKVNIKAADSLGTPVKEQTLPSMIEGIAMTKKGNVFMSFESGAGLYCSDPDNTSEIQVNNVCQIKRSKLDQLQ